MNPNNTIWELIFIRLEDKWTTELQSGGIFNKSDISHHSLQKREKNPILKKNYWCWEVGVTGGRNDKRKAENLPILKDVKSLLHLCRPSLAAAQI